MSSSSQLPSKLPSRHKTPQQKSIYPQKSKGELIVLAFVNQGNYRNALAALNDAKQREGKQGIEISEKLNSLNGQTIKVTGPLHSSLRTWVTALVPYGRVLESRIY
jgi:hypothetical protein